MLFLFVSLTSTFYKIWIICIFLPNLYFLWDLNLDLPFFQSRYFSGKYLWWMLWQSCPDSLSGMKDYCLSCWECHLGDSPQKSALWGSAGLKTAASSKTTPHSRAAWKLSPLTPMRGNSERTSQPQTTQRLPTKTATQPNFSLGPGPLRSLPFHQGWC